MAAAIVFWQLIASMLTSSPRTASASSSSGIAVISLLLSATFPLHEYKAKFGGVGADHVQRRTLGAARSAHALAVDGDRAIQCWHRSPTQRRNTCSKCLRSSMRNRRSRVSAEATLLRRTRKRRNDGSFAWPHSAISVMVSQSARWLRPASRARRVGCRCWGAAGFRCRPGIP